MLQNNTFTLDFSDKGQLICLEFTEDHTGMNWVVDPIYLSTAGYEENDKLFGSFDLTVDNQLYQTKDTVPVINFLSGKATVSYTFEKFKLQFTYDLESDPDALDFHISFVNLTRNPIVINDFGVWTSFAYIMFRDKNILRNTQHSAAAFPSISPDYSKIALHRRSNQGPHLGVYQTEGETFSVGTYCAYENLFFENVSPSLDGILFHKLILAGGYASGEGPLKDWIYKRDAVQVNAGEEKIWSYRMAPYNTEKEFYEIGFSFGHPVIHYSPMTLTGDSFMMTVKLPDGVKIKEADMTFEKDGQLQKKSIANHMRIDPASGKNRFFIPVHVPGEHLVTITLDDGTKDQVIMNVMDSIRTVLSDRTEYISNKLYQGPEGDIPYSYRPISNQGESLGKLSLVLKENLLGTPDIKQVRQVEQSAVYYIRPKWFIEGDFTKPRMLYGDFYRVMDFEYIGHVFYLLSQFDDNILKENTAHTYLRWASEVFNLRVNPDLHDNPRAKEETQMLGLFFLYISDLLDSLKKEGLTRRYEQISAIWKQIIHRVAKQSVNYSGAVTEHFYDNAGFGPSAGALSIFGKHREAERYGELLLANIGYSNDFRAQNPDRWWEALSYMIHSLWGGVSAAAMLKVYEAVHKTEYLLAAYHATVGMLYCYDTHATTTMCQLNKGEAASTYSVAGPHINRPDLSRNRFGQSTFAKDGGIFARLFTDSTSTPDWDMGEEMVAYLDGFGIKTFLYENEEGRIHVVNGSIEETENGNYRIESYAPYSREFHFYGREIHYTADTVTKSIYFNGKQFIKEDTHE